MSIMEADCRHEPAQAHSGPTKSLASLPLHRTKNHGTHTTFSDSITSSRATSPTTDTDISAPSSNSSVNSFMQPPAGGHYAREDSGFQKEPLANDTQWPQFNQMPIIHEAASHPAADKPPTDSPLPMRGENNNVVGSPRPMWPPESKGKNLWFGQVGPESTEDLSESSESMDEYESGDEDGDEDNEWSGEDNTLEELVISSVEGDLAFAASIIPAIQRYRTSRLRSKVESWQSCAAGQHHDSPSNGDVGAMSATNLGEQQDEARGLRRRRSSSSDHGDNHREGGGDDGEGSEQPTDHTPRPDEKLLLLACPFNKHNPAKYSLSTGRKYRACAGPGFKNIQRLKEHLKRTHYPVQCDRCYMIFQSTDKNRPSAMGQLVAHRQAETVCIRGDPSLKEGLSETQWTALEALNRRSKDVHRIEKWNAIWSTIFPNHAQPATPWCEIGMVETFSTGSQASSTEIDNFTNTCVLFVNYRARDFEFHEGHLTKTSAEILERTIRQACAFWMGMNSRTPGSRTSSSLTGSNNGGSFGGTLSTNLTIPKSSTPVTPPSPRMPRAGGQLMLSSCSGGTIEPPAKRQRVNSQNALTRTLSAAPQVTPTLQYPIQTVPYGLPPSIPTGLRPDHSVGINIPMRNYPPTDSQWIIQATSGTDRNPIPVLSDQFWSPSSPYIAFPHPMQPEEAEAFEQSQNLGQGTNMDGNMGNIADMNMGAMGEIGNFGDMNNMGNMGL